MCRNFELNNEVQLYLEKKIFYLIMNLLQSMCYWKRFQDPILKETRSVSIGYGCPYMPLFVNLMTLGQIFFGLHVPQVEN
jgi:hypothetical protein